MRTALTLSLLLTTAPAAAAPSRLALLARLVRAGGDCARTVPLELNQSFPMPVKVSSALRYRLMYYRVEQSGRRQPRAGGPLIAAEFRPDGSGATCAGVPIPKGGAPGPVLSREARKLPFAERQAQRDALYAALEDSAAAYLAGKSGDAAREPAQRFTALWDLLHEPALSAQYKELSPDFWRWLEAL